MVDLLSSGTPPLNSCQYGCEWWVRRGSIPSKLVTGASDVLTDLGGGLLGAVGSDLVIVSQLMMEKRKEMTDLLLDLGGEILATEIRHDC